MPDISQTITLNAVGGDAAAAEIGKTAQALQNVTSSSSGMEQQFQHRFQHIGLMLFAGDALRASGLGAETRMVITSLNAALSAGADMAGISSGGFLLIVTALTALVGIIIKVTEHHKELLATLEKSHEAHQKQIEAVDKTIASINQYVSAGGRASDTTKAWLVANEALRASLIKSQEATDMQIISLLKVKVAQEENNIAIAQSIKLEDMRYLAGVTSGKMATEGARMMTQMAQSVDTLTLALNKDKVALTGAEAELERLRQGNTKTMADMAKGEEELSAAIQAEVNRRQKAYETMQAGIDAVNEAGLKKDEEEWKKRGEIVKQTVDRIGSDFGHAFAQMIVEGKSFTEQMQEAFKQMAEQIIEEIIKMIVEQEILLALETATGTTGWGGVTGAIFGGGHAAGGSMLVDRPTMFLAGEAGPEMATFTPMGAPPSWPGGNGGGGTTIQIGSIQTNVSGVNDPKKIADSVGDLIIQRIRGMGDLNFTRA